MPVELFLSSFIGGLRSEFNSLTPLLKTGIVEFEKFGVITSITTHTPLSLAN